jgi:hypothetical protein
MLTKVASIHWARVQAERTLYGGYYAIEAVPPGAEPLILEVSDKLQQWEGPYSLSPTGTTRSKHSRIVTGEEIAPDIVAEWTQFGVGMNPQCHPGIWVVRERVPETNEDGTRKMDGDNRTIWRSATGTERAVMWSEDFRAAQKADAAYAEVLVRKADQDAEDPRKIPFIPEKAKGAAKQYGIQRDWLKEIASVDMKRCPYCDTLVSSHVAVCKACHNIVDPELYAVLERKKQAALRLAMAENGEEEPALVAK